MGIHVLPSRHYEIFKDLQLLVDAVQRVELGLSAPVPIATLERLTKRLVLVQPHERRRHYRIKFAGDLINEAYGQKLDGKTFRDVRELCGSADVWKYCRVGLQGWSDVYASRSPIITKSRIMFGPQSGREYTRLIVPIMKSGRVIQLAGAINFDDEHTHVRN